MRGNLLLFILVFAAVSCQRLDLAEMSGSVCFRAVMHEEEVVYGRVPAPPVVEVGVYDTLTHERLSRFFLNTSSPLDVHLDPGAYDIIAFGLDVGNAAPRYCERFDLVTLSSTVTGKVSGTDVIAAPSQVFMYVGRGLEIPYASIDDSIRTLTLDLCPFMESFRLEVTGVRGLENARSVRHVIAAQYRDVVVATGLREDNVCLELTGVPDRERGIIACEFCSFGMRPAEEILLTTVIVAADGQRFIRTHDITPQVFPNNGPVNGHSNLIVVDFSVTLSPLGQGGFVPTTEEWDDFLEHYDLL